MEEKINIANEVAGQIDGIAGIACANVDDYNKYGSFQVVAYLDLGSDKKPKNKAFSMLKINKEIKKILKETKEISKIGISIEAPKRVYDKYTYRGITDCLFKGYERGYIMIDFVVINLNEQVSIAELLV